VRFGAALEPLKRLFAIRFRRQMQYQCLENAFDRVAGEVKRVEREITIKQKFGGREPLLGRPVKVS
jgi:hypothetical protein